MRRGASGGWTGSGRKGPGNSSWKQHGSARDSNLQGEYDPHSIGEETELDEVDELEDGLLLESYPGETDDNEEAEEEFVEQATTDRPDESARVDQDRLLKQQWQRKKLDVGSLDPKKQSLVFQQMEVDYYIGDQKPGYPGPPSGKVPIVRMYGVTQEGHSVLCHTRGYVPYFYMEMPKNYDAVPHLESYRAALNVCACVRVCTYPNDDTRLLFTFPPSSALHGTE